MFVVKSTKEVDSRSQHHRDKNLKIHFHREEAVFFFCCGAISSARVQIATGNKRHVSDDVGNPGRGKKCNWVGPKRQQTTVRV